jgi:hypothetical protein
MRWLWRAPLFNGNDGFVLLILAWLVRFLLGQDLRLTARQQHLDRFGQIFVGWGADEVSLGSDPFPTPFPQTHRAAFTAMGFPASSFT